ncbi:hypothetical protein [Alcanivorax sp.]|jgi:hypothetical protein|uniref:hypothetical protein n=1 Tax=Alcanivorax sp. TaxID=1872427 RepID=UPI0025C1CE9E|nr:hypothetical protein [Alcanivorax sp.]
MNIFKRVFYVLAICLFSSVVAAGQWTGPYTVASISSSAESCGSGCGSYYRLRVEVKEDPGTTCQLTNDSGVFVYYSSTINSWGLQWASILMSAQAQAKQVMIYDQGTCSSLGLRLLGVKLVSGND